MVLAGPDGALYSTEECILSSQAHLQCPPE